MNGRNGKNSAKGLILANVFIECFLRERELTVSELLAADPILNCHYGRRPHVLSNVLRRYRELGLLYRTKDYVRGRSYRYNLTEKGFRRLSWMCQNSERYFFRGARARNNSNSISISSVYVPSRNLMPFVSRPASLKPHFSYT